MKVTMKMIDKELRLAGRMIKFFNKTFTEKRLRFLNKLMRNYQLKIRNKSFDFSEIWISRPDGSQLRLCIFKPRNLVRNVPGVLWLHGGGYAIGAPEQSQIWAKKFITASNSIVVMPDYRLSIQAPYPAALEDCYIALIWMKDHASDLGIRGNQLFVGGDSAGGGLTAALSLYTRDRGGPKIAFQMPLYPMIDDRMTTPSATNNDAPVWNSQSNYNGWKLYLGDYFGHPDVPPYAAPARATDYRNLPPTATFVGDLEPFRDETMEYVKNLTKAGIPVYFKLFSGCYHGFDTMSPKASKSQQAIAHIMDAFTYAVEHYYTQP